MDKNNCPGLAVLGVVMKLFNTILLGMLVSLPVHGQGNGSANPNSPAKQTWNPFDGGIYDERIQLRSTAIALFEWVANRLGSPDCSMEPDTHRISKHDIRGFRLGDVCNLQPDSRGAITDSARVSVLKVVELAKEEMAREGDLMKGRDGLGDDRINRLRGGLSGGDTDGLILNQGADPMKFYLLFSHTEPSRVYISSIDRTFCAPAIENTLVPSSSFMGALIAKYGKPTESLTKNQKDQQELKEMEAQIDAVSRLVDLKESLAVTGKSHAEVARDREKENQLRAMLKAGETKAHGKGDFVIAHAWAYETYHVSIRRIGECGELKPKYEMTMKVGGREGNLLADLAKDAVERSKQLAQERAKSRQSNVPLPNF